MPKKQPARKQKTSQALWWVTGAAVVIVGAVVAYSTYSSRQPVTPISSKSDAEIGAVRTVQGKATAKVKLVEFGDFL